MFGFKPLHPRHWARRIACVPKGFLRFHVLRLLASKPMSGSEIISEIEKETGGRWRPSPGSVYPLLAWLQDNGYVREQPAEETGIKRYVLTEQGHKYLEEEMKFRRESGLTGFPPFPLLGDIWPLSKVESLRSLMDSARRLTASIINLGMSIRDIPIEQYAKQAEAILNEAADKIEELNRRIKNEKTSQNM
ncbi:MAG: PadR family transcriptional regulator [Nitrososphaerota archaeon]|nr:PadR family transcriptional regulator [Candidatus Bathyarchaeota archaeon]MDW8048934.1 PadR family transcriptional regulator [Nitrososphaerota archaeon]